VTTGSSLLDGLLEIAAAAASAVLDTYLTDFDVELKGPNDPVTSADRRANQLICDALRDLHPGCPIVAEDSAPSAFGDYQHAPQVFFVDPVDGTREFVKRTGEFVVMIGCVQERQARAGIIWSPTLETVWIGEVSLGAFRRTSQGAFVPIHPAAKTSTDAARLLVSRAHDPVESLSLQTRLEVPRLEAMGSAGLKAAAVADGTADAYVAPRYAGKRWDACAPDAIVTAAGGVFTDGTGSAVDYRSEDLVNRLGLVAANATLHRLLIQRLRPS